jgi:hypothetical protein
LLNTHGADLLLDQGPVFAGGAATTELANKMVGWTSFTKNAPILYQHEAVRLPPRPEDSHSSAKNLTNFKNTA